MNIVLLEEIIKQSGDSFKAVAELLSVSEEKLYSMLVDGYDDLGSYDICLIRDQYNLTKEQVNEIFFA